jgi:LysM repeat protein
VSLLALVGLCSAVAFADTAAPTVAITSPQPGLTISTNTVEVAVSYVAPAQETIARVVLLVDGDTISDITLDPPQESGAHYFRWDATGCEDGRHQIVVRAFDSHARAAAKGISVFLQRGLPDLRERLRIVSPVSGDTVSGITSVQLDGDPQSSTRYVIFLVDNVFKAMTNVRPFIYRWDTTRYLNGLHNLQARAYLETVEYLTGTVQVRVDNPSGATTMLPASPAPAPVAPAPPARAAEPALPPPMHTESPAAEASSVEVSEPEVARPGTAPFVSPAGDLIQPPPAPAAELSPAASPVQIAALPDAALAPETAPLVATVAAPPAPAVTAEPSTAPGLPESLEPAAIDTAPAEQGAPSASPVETSSLPSTASEPTPAPAPLPAGSPVAPASAPGAAPEHPHTPQLAPTEIAALPDQAAEPPVPAAPAQSIAAPASWRTAVTTSRAAAPEELPTSATQVAMLPPLPTAPAPRPVLAAQPAPQPVTYAVQPGDCLWRIAEQHGVPPAALAAANGLSDPRNIHPGQVLSIPVARVYCDGKPLPSGTPPVVMQGRALAPFRAIVETLGGSVVWEPATRTARASARGRDIAVTIGSDRACVDNRTVAMGAPAELRANRTLTPLRFLGDALQVTLRYQPGLITIASGQ